ncbi:uncharacterized protein [Watersipora subatra]|uniref:uncharacterized protein n=1 Tax=Watersipora subatra TaxID=2589382 RepID=UPI00355B94DA
MAAAVTEDIRCGFCWQDFNNLDDPRELDCSHVFCLSCLKEDCDRKNGILECPICQQTYTAVDFNNLRKAVLDENTEEAPVSQSKCDGADCKQKLAISYCVQCGEKACPEHEETHKKHFGSKHRVIPIGVYDESPENFKKPVCNDHKYPEKMILACSVCDRLVCNECDRHNPPCLDDKKHDYHKFDELEKGLTDEYKKLLREADAKLTEMYKLEKETWSYLDNDAINRNNLIEEAERARKAKIEYQNLLFEKIVEKVKADQVAPTEKIEGFTASLSKKKEALDEMRTRARRLMRDGSVTEKIRQRKQITDIMKQQLEEELGSCALETYTLPPVEVLLPKESFTLADIDNIDIVSCEFATKKTCYDMDVLPSKQIVCAGNRSIDVFDNTGTPTRTIFTKEGDYTSIQVYKGHIYALLKAPQHTATHARWVIKFEENTFKEVHRWDLPPYKFVSMLAVSNDKVFVINNDGPKVKMNVYSTDGELLRDISCDDQFKKPVYMCPLGDDGILVADRTANAVYKINSIDEKVDEVYPVPSPRGVYCDPSGNWWIWSSEEKSIYLRSADGQKNRTLSKNFVKGKGAEYLCGFATVNGNLYAAASGLGILRMDIHVAQA